MNSYHIAQLNIALLKDKIDSPLLKDFVDNLDRINALAEASPGFVWRLQSEDGDATSFKPFGDDYIVNMTVWENIPTLHYYVYQTAHVQIMKRRKEWFERMREAYSVLWWVPAGHLPTLEEAKEKLQLLQQIGPTAQAFTFKKSFPAPSDSSGETTEFDDLCPAT